MDDFRTFDDTYECKEAIEQMLKSEYFDVVRSRKHSIEESNGSVSYSLNVEFEDENEIIILKNIEELKKSTRSYVVDPSSLTHDCDAIILDFKRTVVVFIEMKSSGLESTQAVYGQLMSGKKWFEHLMFCSKISIKNFSNWQSFSVYAIVEQDKRKVNARRRHEPKSLTKCKVGKSYYKYLGGSMLYGHLLAQVAGQTTKFSKLNY